MLQLGSTAIGIQTNEGVVLAVEKRVTSPLIEPSSIEKIMEVDTHIGKTHFYFALFSFYVLLTGIFTFICSPLFALKECFTELQVSTTHPFRVFT